MHLANPVVYLTPDTLERLRERLLSPAAKRIARTIYGTTPEIDDGQIWDKGLCLVLATALARNTGLPVILAVDTEGSWWHGALLLPDGTTLDSEEVMTQDALLEMNEPEGVDHLEIVDAEEAYRRIDADMRPLVEPLRRVLLGVI